MAYFVISNFASGQDLRRSTETAPSGSLRVLRNAFVNEGGEIEKRKAFVRQEDVTAYAQGADFKGRITGPFVCPSSSRSVFFRHRDAAVPGAPFQDNGNDAVFVEDADDVTGRVLQRFWVFPSAETLTADQALFHAASQAEFSNTSYAVEAYIEEATLDTRYQHVITTFTDDEPISEAAVAANADRTYQRILNNKSYVARGRTLYGSAVGSPGDMAGAGSWSTDLTTQGTPIGDALAIGEYFGQLVVFGERGMMFWGVDADPDLNQYLRTVDGSAFGPRSITGYSDGDILYLSKSGIRSLQARDSSNQARVSDVGSPIDSEIRARLNADTNDTDPLFDDISPEVVNSPFYNLATGIVHKDSGQAWIALRDKIYVLSRYPSAKVLAWSSFDLPFPDFETPVAGTGKAQWVADWCEINDTVVLRNFADEVFVYGGENGASYDTSEVEVIMPFMDMGRPGSTKRFSGIDVVCEGIWRIDYATDHFGDSRDTIWEPLAVVDGSSRSGSKISFTAAGSQIALRMRCQDSFAAKLSEVLIYYNDGSQK